tara:strand:+ start:962 stop:2590 length:1629 start_codon:yes stop_codon:yes gene_type:complete
MAFVPDTQQAPRFVPDEVATPASTAYAGPVIQENPVWTSTGGGAAMGRPRMVDRTNVQAQPRPLESALAGMTKSAIDPLVATAQLATGGNLGTSELAQNLDKQADVYYNANPVSYGAGRVAGAVAPAAAITRGAGMIPSFARANPMVQGSALGATSGLITPINTGATGKEMYSDVGQNVALGTTLGGVIPAGGQIANMLRGKGPNPQMVQSIQQARDLGYVIPPTQANPSMLNRFMEGVAGKLSTAQNASAKNQEITNRLAAKSLGLAEDTVITPQMLTDLRTTAGNAYTNLGLSGQVMADKSYINALDDIAKPYLVAAKGFPNSPPSPVINLVQSLKSPSFDATAAVEKVRQLRTAADDAFRTGNTDIARASKSAATAIENALEGHLSKTNQTDLLTKFKDARQIIAKTYSVEKAANTTTGTIDAKKLAAQLQRGKPLSAELKSIAQFSQAFPKASQATEAMGSLPQLSPLDYFAGLIGGVSTGGVGAGAILARPALRAAALSSPVQNRLIPNTAAPFLTPDQRNLSRLLTLQGAQGATNE